MGVARFARISRGGACGRGQVLVKSQGQNLAWVKAENGGSKLLTLVTGGSTESMQPTSPCMSLAS